MPDLLARTSWLRPARLPGSASCRGCPSLRGTTTPARQPLQEWTTAAAWRVQARILSQPLSRVLQAWLPQLILTA